MTPIDAQNAASVPPTKPPQPSRLWATVRTLLRARVTAGLLFVLPIWITYLLVKFIFELMRDTSLWVVDWYLKGWGEALLLAWGVEATKFAEDGLAVLPARWQWGVSIAAVLLTVFFLYLVGVFTANIVGRRLVRVAEALLERVPFVKTIYTASKKILGTFAGEAGQGYQRVVLIPFPSGETRSMGFLTGSSHDPNTGEEICTVFLATAPNPTSGFVFMVRRSDIIELDWTVEDAIKTLLSGGTMVPPSIPLGAPGAVLRRRTDTVPSNAVAS